MGRTACTEPQCLYKGALYLSLLACLNDQPAENCMSWSPLTYCLHVTKLAGHYSVHKGQPSVRVRRYVTSVHTLSNYSANTYILTQCSRVHLEKLTGLQPVKKFPAFYGPRSSLTAFTISRHLSLSWASSIQSIPSHPPSWRFVLILSCHLRLGLLSGLFPSGFPTKTQCKYIWI